MQHPCSRALCGALVLIVHAVPAAAIALEPPECATVTGAFDLDVP